MAQQNLTVTALVRRNSIGFIEAVFALNEARRPFVVVSEGSLEDLLPDMDIERCIVPENDSGWFTQCHPLQFDDRPAQITYTSGTEGKPKGVILTLSNLADAAERIIAEMGLTADIREYVGVPVAYSFGLGRVRAVSAVGGQSYLPPRGFDPIELARMLTSGEVNALSAVPTLLRILLQSPTLIGAAGHKLRWLEIGSQYMTGDEKRAIHAIFPNARIVQHYGLTEASRSTFLHISEVADDKLDSVGVAVGATEIAISERGRIQIRGPHVARSRVDADRLVDLCNSDGWLETNDLGHMEDGYLFYDGRADDLVNIGGIKINPDTLEARIGQLLGRRTDVVVTKVPDALRGEGVLVATGSAGISIDRLRSASDEALRELGIAAGDALHVQIVSAMPQTATGKPLRRRLSEDFIQAQKATAEVRSVEPVAEPRVASVETFSDSSSRDGRSVGRIASKVSAGIHSAISSSRSASKAALARYQMAGKR